MPCNDQIANYTSMIHKEDTISSVRKNNMGLRLMRNSGVKTSQAWHVGLSGDLNHRVHENKTWSIWLANGHALEKLRKLDIVPAKLQTVKNALTKMKEYDVEKCETILDIYTLQVL